VTTLHVTHSRAEARHLADKLVILKGGQLEDRGLADLAHLPAEVLRPPAGDKSAYAAESFTR